MLRRLVIGGAAAPAALIDGFERLGIEVLHGWGMTEMSPLGAIIASLAGEEDLPRDVIVSRRTRQGRAIFPIAAKIVDAKGNNLPHDDLTAGNLTVSGPTVVARLLRRRNGCS